MRGAVEQQREGLHGLAEAHVVGQARARAPSGKPREPAKAVVLIGAKLRAQRARQLRLERVRVAQALALRVPPRVRVEGRALGEVPQRKRRRAVHAYRAARGRRGEAAQIVEVAAQRRGQRDELAGSELQESRSGARIEQREQLLEIEHPAFVDLERAGGAEPLRRGLDRQVQLRGPGARDDLQRLALRPQRARPPRGAAPAAPGAGRVGEHPRRRLGGGCGECRAGGDDALGAGALGREVAPGLHRLAVATGEHRRSARAGLEARPGPRDGLDHQLRREPRPRGLEPHPGARVRLDHMRGLGTALDTPVDANLGGKAGHRVQQPGPHRGGKLQAALGDDRPQPLVAGREPDHLATPAVREPHMVMLGVAVVGDEACAQAPLVLVDHELGLPSHDFHHRAGLVEDVRVTGKLEQRPLVHGVAQPAVPVADLPDLRRGGAVLLQQEIHRRGRRGEPLERDRLAGGPRAVPVLMLLARPGHDLAGVFAELPRQPAPAGGRTTLLRRGRLVAGLERQLLQRLQGILPLRHRLEQG